MAKEPMTLEAAKSEALAAGWDLATFQKFAEWAGVHAPILWTAFKRLVEIFQTTAPKFEGMQAASAHTPCCQELKDALCEAEVKAINTLGQIMVARQIACCEDEPCQ